MQGVGFRPYVFRLATELGLGGFVLNDARGVLLEVEGRPEQVESFFDRLVAERAAARRDRGGSEGRTRSPTASAGFGSSPPTTPASRRRQVSPDMATCADCLGGALRPGRPPLPLSVHQLHELRPAVHDRARRPLRPAADDDGRLRDVPACRAEYEDPLDRRFHAQPNACPRLRAAGAAARRRRRAIADRGRPDRGGGGAPRATGAIVAVKGIGGYHLACVAADERAVAALRARKHREDKPFALMAADLRRGGSTGRAEPRGRKSC